MAIFQKRSKRKSTGGRYKSALSRKLHQRGNHPARTTVGEKRTQRTTTRGGETKQKLLSDKTVNVRDPKKGTQVKATIERVAENPANRHFVRRNIVTRGAVVMTDKGKVRITNRPGQEGSLQGVLTE